MTNFTLKEFADDNFEFDTNSGKSFGKKVKLLVTSAFSFYHRVFKRLVKTQVCLGNDPGKLSFLKILWKKKKIACNQDFLLCVPKCFLPYQEINALKTLAWYLS